MDSKPVLPMNRPFAEMGYNSSGLNIVLERLLLATRRPSTHYPLASGAAFFDPLRAICRRATNHLQHTAQHLATPCKPSAVVLRSTWDPLHSIRHLAACHPLAPAPHPSALCMPSARQFTTRYPPAHRKPSAIARHSILRPPRVIRWHPAGICWHEPMLLTARRTNRRREQEP